VLFLLGAVGFIMTNLFVTANRMRESITMIVELNDGLSEEQRNFVAERIAESDLVLSMRFVSKEEKAEDEEFKRIFAIDINSVLGVNPLPDSYDVTLSKLSSDKEALSKFAEELRQVEGISFVSYPQTFIEEMHSTLDLLQLILAIFAGVLLIVSFILLNNTIRLTVYSRRELINTLKAVGATKWFIMRPFLGRSVLQGLLAGIFAAVLLGGALYGLNYLAPGFGLFPKWERLAILGGSIVAMGIIVATLCTIPIVSRFVNMRSNKIHLC
jgi:cell division transport system permease protein